MFRFIFKPFSGSYYFMLKVLISCWYDGVVVTCRYMFAVGLDVVLVRLLLYCLSVYCLVPMPCYIV